MSAEYIKDLRELMVQWDKIEAAAMQLYPNASKDELYSICRKRMLQTLTRINTPIAQALKKSMMTAEEDKNEL